MINKYKLLLFLTIISAIMAVIIVPDKQNPFIIKNPNVGETSTIVLNFELGEGTKGLQYSQYIAIEFPKSDSAVENLGTSNFMFHLEGASSCKLYKDPSTVIETKWVPSQYGDENICFCQITETANTDRVPLTKGIVYRLEVTLPNAQQKPSSIFWKNFGLHTKSSNSPNGLIIDSNPNFASGVIFPNVATLTTDVLKIVDISKVEGGKDSATPTLYYNTLDIRLGFKANLTLKGQESLLLITYPSSVTLPTSYESVTNPTDSVDPLKQKLQGTIKFVKMDANTHLLSGISEQWIQKNREFSLLAKNFISTDASISSPMLSVKVIYSNTNVVQSYSEKAFLTFSLLTMDLTIEHPEGWEIYMSGAWPLLFTYKLTSTVTLNLANGAYVVIQHNNLIPAFEIWNFASATCDFSANPTSYSEFGFTFGQRNNCHPLQNENLEFGAVFNDADTGASTGVKGSGIYFKQPTLISGRAYVVQVWGVADVCGKPNHRTLTDAANRADPLTASTAATTFNNFSFEVRLYTKIDKTTKSLFAEKDRITVPFTAKLLNKCWSVFRGEGTYSDQNPPLEFKQFETYNTDSQTAPYLLNNPNLQQIASPSPASTKAEQPANAKYDCNMYKEFYDPVIINAPNSASPTPASTTYVANVNQVGTDLIAADYIKSSYGFIDDNTSSTNTNLASFQPLFLYTTVALNSATGFSGGVALRGDYSTTGSLASPYIGDSSDGLPTSMFLNKETITTSNYKGMRIQSQGNIEVFFSKKYFSPSSLTISNCVLSWQVGAPFEPATDMANDATTYKVQTIVKGTIAAPGYVQTFFPVTAADFTVLDTDWYSDPTDNTFITTYGPRLINYYIKGTSIDTTSTIPSTSTTPKTIMIRSILNNEGQTHPGGKYFTFNPPTLGYKATITTINAAAATSLTCTAIVCSNVFNIYTNCLKWVNAAPTSTTLYDYLDVIYRFNPAILGVLRNNGPSRTIRFIKLFPEAQAMNDPLKKVSISTANSWFGRINMQPSAGDSSENNNFDWGKVCLVEIYSQSITDLLSSSMVSNTVNTLALFIFNASLLETDTDDVAATYPATGLGSGYKAYANNSAPYYTLFGHMGSYQGQYYNQIQYRPHQSHIYGYGQKNDGLTHTMDGPNSARSSDIFVSNLTCGQGNGRSSHSVLLGATIFINGITNKTNPLNDSRVSSVAGNSNLVIPTKCPPGFGLFANTNEAAAAYSRANVYMTALTMNSYKDVKVEGIMRNTFKQPSFLANTSTFIGDYNYSKALSKNTSAANTDFDKFKFKLKVYFDSYIATSNVSNKLALKLSDPDSFGSEYALYMGSSIIFLKEGVITSSTGVWLNNPSTTGTASTDLFREYTSNTFFYFYQQKFKKAIINTSASFFINGVNNDPHYIYGIERPTSLSNWVNSNQTASTTYPFRYSEFLVNIAKWPCFIYETRCQFEGELSKIATNFEYYGLNNYAFNIGYIGDSLSTTNNGVTISVTHDKPSTVTVPNYKDDPAGNLKITTNFPLADKKLPAKSIIYVTSSIFSENTICGVQYTNGFSNDCIRSEYHMKCPLTQVASTGEVVVCCYNVQMSVNPSISHIGLEFESIYTTVKYTNFLMVSYSKATTGNTAFEYSFGNNTAAISTLTSILNQPIYSVKQENALGVITFSITLPREPVRDGKIILEGDFVNFVNGLNLNLVRCVPSFSNFGLGNDWSKGDILFDYCDISNINSPSNSIVIVTKKVIYKCGSAFDTTLYITLSHVFLPKIPIDDNFRVLMKGPGGALANENLINAANLNFQNSSTVFNNLEAAPKINFIPDVLCPLKYLGVYPRIPGSLIDFTFDFDLKSYQSTLALYTEKVNEFTIFLPYKYFNDWANNTLKSATCSSGGQKVQCSFADAGVLNVYLGNNVATDSIVSVSILNVPFGVMDENISFLCSVNYTNSVTSRRINLLTGSGIMLWNTDKPTENIIGVNQVALLANTYNIDFFSDYKKTDGTTVGFKVLSDSSLQFRAGIDRYGVTGTTNLKEIKVTNSPIFHIFLPVDFTNLIYQFSGQVTFKPVVTITEYYLSDSLVETSASLNINPVVVSGNRLSVTLTGDLTIPVTHKFWEIAIYGLIFPLNKVNSGMFNLALTNNDYSFLLKSWTSAQNQVNTQLPLTYLEMPAPTDTNSPTVNPFYTYQRGLNLVGNAIKWEVSLNNGTNAMTINAGRYSPQEFNIKSNPTLAYTKSSITQISISNDKIFSFPTNKNYYISTAELKLTVMVGAPCVSANPGSFIVFFSVLAEGFFSLPPITTNLVRDKKGVLDISLAAPNKGKSPKTFPGGTVPFSYSFLTTDTNVDEITGVWQSSAGNDPSAVMSMPIIPNNTESINGSFYITNSDQTKPQTFTLTITNECFTPSNTSFTIELTDTAPILGTATDVSKWFVYHEPSTDTTLTLSSPPRLNGLHWTVTASIYPINMYCALYCKDDSIPSNEDLIAQNFTAGPLLQFYKAFLANNIAQEVYFTGLARGQAYALTCLFVTLEAVVSKRTTSKVTFKSSPDPKDNSKQLSQIPTPVDPTQCAYYTFTTPPSLDLKLAILGYCQNIFTPGGSFPINDGCVVCTDDEKRTVASQTSATQNNIPTDVVCRSSTTNPVRILRELTTGTTTSAIAVPTYQYYICGVPSVLCNSNTPKISLRNLRNLQSIDTGIRRILQKNVIEALSTPNQFEIALGIKNVSVVKVELIDGSFSPKIAFTTGASSNTMFGEYKTYINFSSEGQFDCYYKVQKQTTPSPTATDIKSCTNTNNCGKFVLKSPGMGISNIALPGFIVGTTYGVYAVCYNQSTSSVFASDVFIAYSFVPVCPDSFVLDANKNCVSTIMTTTKNDTVIAKGSFMREIGLFSTLFVILFALIFE